MASSDPIYRQAGSPTAKIARLRRFARQHCDELSGVDVSATDGVVFLTFASNVYAVNDRTRTKIVGPLSASFWVLRAEIVRLYGEMSGL